MSFDMQRIPPEPQKQEKLALYMWALAYFTLGIAFVVMTWIFAIKRRGGLSVFCAVSSWVCFYFSTKRINEFKVYQDMDNE